MIGVFTCTYARSNIAVQWALFEQFRIACQFARGATAESEAERVREYVALSASVAIPARGAMA